MGKDLSSLLLIIIIYYYFYIKVQKYRVQCAYICRCIDHLSFVFAVDRLQVERCGQQMYQRSLPASPPLLRQPRRECYHHRWCLKKKQQPFSLQDLRQWRRARYDPSQSVLVLQWFVWSILTASFYGIYDPDTLIMMTRPHHCYHLEILLATSLCSMGGNEVLI